MKIEKEQTLEEVNNNLILEEIDLDHILSDAILIYQNQEENILSECFKKALVKELKMTGYREWQIKDIDKINLDIIFRNLID